jgi:hypothetical protein
VKKHSGRCITMQLRNRRSERTRRRASRKLSIAILAVWLGSIAVVTGSKGETTTSDQAVQHEFDIARPEIIRLNRLLNAELVRALSGSDPAPSPAMKQVIEESAESHIALSDTGVPLHLRLIERQRLEVIAGFRWAAATIGHCDEKAFNPGDLLDVQSRLRIISVSRCHQRYLDRGELQLHELKVANEASVLELRLPSAFQKRMLTQARQSTERQDAEMASIYAHRRAFWRATDDLVEFFDMHPAHLAANQIVMDNDSDSVAAQDLLSQFVETAKHQ